MIHKTTTPKTGLFPVYPYSSPSGKRSANQRGIKRPVFLPVIQVIPHSTPVYRLSENRCEKVPQSDRLSGLGQKENIPKLSPDCHFEPLLICVERAGPERGSAIDMVSRWCRHRLQNRWIRVQPGLRQSVFLRFRDRESGHRLPRRWNRPQPVVPGGL